MKKLFLIFLLLLFGCANESTDFDISLTPKSNIPSSIETSNPAPEYAPKETAQPSNNELIEDEIIQDVVPTQSEVEAEEVISENVEI